jgi:hypothetical protein
MIEGASSAPLCSAIDKMPVSGGVSFVEMVQSTDLRNRNDFTNGLNGSTFVDRKSVAHEIFSSHN